MVVTSFLELFHGCKPQFEGLTFEDQFSSPDLEAKCLKSHLISLSILGFQILLLLFDFTVGQSGNSCQPPWIRIMLGTLVPSLTMLTLVL
jgi:hypothetical protein